MKRAPWLTAACCASWVCVMLLAGAAGCRYRAEQTVEPSPALVAEPCLPVYTCSPTDDAFLDDVERRVFEYFWAEVYPETGIAIDHTENRIGKVAATGFELAAVCVGVHRQWITYEQGYERALRILNAFWDDPDDPADGFAEGKFGLYWHFVDGHTGRKVPLDCVAMCDSADFVAGAILAGEFFKGTEVETLANRIYDNVQWDAFVMPKTDGSPGLMSFGWVPPGVSESYPKVDGLLPMAMEGLSDNSLLIYVLALGSDTHPIPQATWEQYVDTYAIDEYAGYSCARTGALFCRQVPQSFIRFSRKRDRKMDYFLDTANAILADRAFNVRENNYPPEAWGLTDCFGKESYSHGAPPGPVMNDGTVGSTAFVGALPHVPDVSLAAMHFARNRLGDRIWGKYGFTSSYNLKNDFCSPLYVGIELGPIIMMIENYRSGLIWDLFMRHKAARNFLQRGEFSGVVDDFELPPEAPPYADWSVIGGRGIVTGDAAQHGQFGLSIKQNERAGISIEGQLTDNDLLDFSFGAFLTCWARDINLTSAVVSVNGYAARVPCVGRLPGSDWTHFYFALPAAVRTGRLCGVRFDGSVTGSSPAFDNCTMEAGMPASVPATPMDFTAGEGRVPGTVTLQWMVPGGDVRAFVIRISGDGVEGSMHRFVERDVLESAGVKQEESVSVAGSGLYRFSVASRDRFGHTSPYSPECATRARGGSAVVRIPAVDESGMVRWPWTDEGWSVRASEPDASGGRHMDVTFKKRQAWDFFEIPLNPDMVAMYRYLVIRMRGDVKLLAKLWSSDASQSDMNAPAISTDGDWKLLKYDTTTANLKPRDRREVVKLLLFPAAGLPSAEGSFSIDWIEYAGE